MKSIAAKSNSKYITELEPCKLPIGLYNFQIIETTFLRSWYQKTINPDTGEKIPGILSKDGVESCFIYILEDKVSKQKMMLPIWRWTEKMKWAGDKITKNCDVDDSFWMVLAARYHYWNGEPVLDAEGKHVYDVSANLREIHKIKPVLWGMPSQTEDGIADGPFRSMDVMLKEAPVNKEEQAALLMPVESKVMSALQPSNDFDVMTETNTIMPETRYECQDCFEDHSPVKTCDKPTCRNYMPF